MKLLIKLKWWVIWILLNKKERDLFIANLCYQIDTLEQYANCLGETFEEFCKELTKMNIHYAKYNNSRQKK